MGLIRPYGKLNHSGIMQRVARIESRAIGFPKATPYRMPPEIRNMRLKVFKLRPEDAAELEAMRARGIEARKQAKLIGEQINERKRGILADAGYTGFDDMRRFEISADGAHIVVEEYDENEKRPAK